MDRRRFFIFLCGVWATVAVGDQSEVDKEIVKDLDFFYFMDTVEHAELVENLGDPEEDGKGVSDGDDGN